MTRDDAIIVLLDGADPDVDRVTRSTARGQLTFVGVGDPDQAPGVASDLVGDGVERLELCGGLGPAEAGKVVRAVRGRASVGAVSFGVESVDAAARFRDRVLAGARQTAGFLYLQDGADPVADRTVLDPGPLRTWFVPVPDESQLAAVASAMVEQEDSELIELYRGVGPVALTQVIESVDGRAAVGAVRHGRS